MCVATCRFTVLSSASRTRRRLAGAGEPAALERIVAENAAIKARVVGGDERDGGRRMILNYGHTLAHALESFFHYRFLTHGEAVAYPMRP